MSENETTDAIVAEAAESTTVTVKWRDLDPFDIPMYRDDWPFEAVLAAESNEDALLLANLMPAEAFRQFRQTKPKKRDADDLLDAIGKALGLAHSGESSASAS